MMLRKFVSLALAALFQISCTVSEPIPDAQAVSGDVRARMRQPVPVVLMGLQDAISIQRPVSRGDVWKQASGNAEETMESIAGVARESDPHAALFLAPFVALALVAPPLLMVKSLATGSEKNANDSAEKVNTRTTPRNWGQYTRAAVERQWAARGTSFGSVRVYNPASPAAGPNPLSKTGLENAGGRTLLHLHFAGPALTAEGDRMNPRIGPSLMIFWKVVDTSSAAVLARGTITERSPSRKSLREWARRDPGDLEREMERIINSAGSRLAAELR